MNWETIYFNHFSSKTFPIHGILLAIFPHDLLRRKFMPFVFQPHVYANYFSPHQTIDEVFQLVRQQGRSTPLIAHNYELLAPDEINDRIANINQRRWGFPWLQYRHTGLRAIRWLFNPPKYPPTEEIIGSNFGAIRRIIDHARSVGRYAAIASIPASSERNAQETAPIIQALAVGNSVPYFDGIGLFSNPPGYQGRRKDLFFRRDGHWNQQGSDLFAQSIIDQFGDVLRKR